MTHDIRADPASRFVVGIDLGGTKLHAALATTEGRVVAERTEPTEQTDPRSVLTQLERTVRMLCSDFDISLDRLIATGIGGAGVPNGETASFDLAPSLGGVETVRLVDELESRLGHPVVLENDVNVAALGELAEGIGRERDNFVFISVGTGIGMGIVIDGRLVRGSRGRAGEIGYLPFGADPLDSANHRRGPLEEMVAGHMIADHYHARTTQSIGTRAVFERARAGDADAIAAIDYEAEWLARAIVAVDVVINPAAFVLGGGIGSQPEILTLVRPWLDRLGVSGLDVRQSQLAEAAPIVGAVRLAIESAMDDVNLLTGLSR